MTSVLGSGDQAVLQSVTRPAQGAPLPGSDAARLSPLGARAALQAADVGTRGPTYLEEGRGRVVGKPREPSGERGAGEGALKLNFENTPVLEVVKVVLTDMLGQSYVVDPGVQGTVTLQTTRPISRDELLPTLELMLRMNGAALVWSDGLYHIVPTDAATQGLTVPQLGDSARPVPKGYSLQIVPLRYVAAAEMQGILEPLSSPGTILRVDAERNLLILGGTEQELTVMRDTVAVFDVDWLAGQSIALFSPRFVDAKTLAEEVNAIIGDGRSGSLAGLVRVAAMERLDAVLVISANRAYVERIGRWIEHLDRNTGGSGQRLFVYHVQNGKAVDLANVLNEVFREERARAVPRAEVAPGLQGVERQSEAQTETPAERNGDASADRNENAAARRAQAAQQARAAAGPGQGLSITPTAEMRIIADEINNALLIMATAQQFQQVESALRELDIAPLQVLIEATIAEVSLTGELSQGLEWFFKNHIGGDHSGVASLDLGAAGLAALVPGFSYAVTEASVVKAVLNILAQDSRANIVSSPSIMVLNNQEASIQVGDQVPITTQQQQSTSVNSNVVNSIEFRDTGVLLTVTPRVNAGGLVIMDVEQEVSNVAPGDANTLTPTIQQRRIASTVAVQSAETVVLGGLIRENQSEIASGIPGLYRLPLVGKLFGTQTDQASRTELVVLITPRAVRGVDDARGVTDEFRRKMQSLRPLTGGAPVSDGARLGQTSGGGEATPDALQAAPARTLPLPGVRTPAGVPEDSGQSAGKPGREWGQAPASVAVPAPARPFAESEEPSATEKSPAVKDQAAESGHELAPVTNPLDMPGTQPGFLLEPALSEDSVSSVELDRVLSLERQPFADARESSNDIDSGRATEGGEPLLATGGQAEQRQDQTAVTGTNYPGTFGRDLPWTFGPVRTIAPTPKPPALSADVPLERLEPAEPDAVSPAHLAGLRQALAALQSATSGATP